MKYEIGCVYIKIPLPVQAHYYLVGMKCNKSEQNYVEHKYEWAYGYDAVAGI
jgi:hypothetical protein